MNSEFENVDIVLSRRKHERFIKYCWQDSSEKFIVGLHIRELCYLIDRAMYDFKNGKSTYLVVKIPFRHGKSSVLSRYLPAHFLARNKDKEVMLVTYASSLAEDFSRFARDLLKTDEFQRLYPDVKLNNSASGVQQWQIADSVGKCVASGLGSGITGRGYHLGLLDDYCASRAEAESETLRNKAWEHFTNDFLTRRAPVSITIILATPWHTDDIIGRIEGSMDPNSERYNPEFPKFNIVSFPAKNGEVVVHEQENGEYIERKKAYQYLFLERFSSGWYEEQFAALGSYAAAALLQCSPQVRGGNMLKVQNVREHKSLTEFPQTRYIRVWDLAHTAKERIKDDPDYTSGTLLAFVKTDGMWHLWIKDVKRFREDTPMRDRLIRAATENDGMGVPVAIEDSLDSKDAIKILREILRGKRVVKGIRTKGDKVMRASPLEAVFEAGNVHILKADWNFDWYAEMKEFPNGKHDDQVDNLSAGFTLYDTPETITISRISGL